MKSNLAYFTHDTDAHRHPKMKALRAKYGMAGYGRFWILNELIAAADECALDVSTEINRLSLAEDLGYREGETAVFDDYLSFLSSPDIRLIHDEGGFLSTSRVADDYGRVSTKRKAERQRKKDAALPPQNPDGNSPEDTFRTENGTFRTEIMLFRPEKTTDETRQDETRVLDNQTDETRKNKDEEKNKQTGREDPGKFSRAPLSPDMSEPIPTGREDGNEGGGLTLDQVLGALAHAPFPATFSPDAAEQIRFRLASLGLGIGFIAFALEKANAAHVRKPSGLLYKQLTTGTEWVNEWRWKSAPPAKRKKLPAVPASCPACGGRLIATRYEAQCVSCRQFIQLDIKTGAWQAVPDETRETPSETGSEKIKKIDTS